MKRRDIIKGLTLLPLGGSFLGTVLPSESKAGSPLKSPDQAKSDG